MDKTERELQFAVRGVVSDGELKFAFRQMIERKR